MKHLGEKRVFPQHFMELLDDWHLPAVGVFHLLEEKANQGATCRYFCFADGDSPQLTSEQGQLGPRVSFC